MKLLRLLLTCLLLTHSLLGQAQTWRPYVQPNSAEILHRLQKLQVLGSCLYIAAHPDDENTRLLAWLANEKKVRTGYLSLTRGDGGQNLIGPEQGEALGIIRTQELLAARRIDGAEQFFTRAYDFGYSKTPEETFRIWNKDSVLADVVWVIRQFRPDVIITRFPTTGEGGHGHHTASAMLAVEAFDAAADPTRFPEQLQYVSVWQAKRLFWNTFNFGGNNTTAADQLQVDVGGYNPLLGKSYGEIAAEARTMHKSQGFGSARQRGSSMEYFKLLKGEKAEKDLFEGVDLTWGRYHVPSLDKMTAELVASFNALKPANSLSQLLNIRRTINKNVGLEIGEGFISVLRNELEELAFACAGGWIETAAGMTSGMPSDEASIRIQFLNRDSLRLFRQDYLLRNSNEEPTSPLITPLGWGRELKTGVVHTDTLDLGISANEYDRRVSGLTGTSLERANRRSEFSSPYWLDAPIERGLFSVTDRCLIGIPEARSLHAHFFLATIFSRRDTAHITIDRPVVYKTTDPVKGEIYRPFEILPPVTANFSDRAFVFEGSGQKTIPIRVQSHGDSAKGTLELTAPAGWKVSIPNPAFNLKGRGAEVTMQATVKPLGSAETTDGTLKATLLVGGERYTRGIRRIEYDHIPAQFYLPPAEARLVPVALKTGGKAIGYIVGAGDDVPAALRGVGYTVTELDEAAVMKTDLSKYSAIVTGVRAYNTQDWLQGAHEKLAAYVRAGGNLVVQYNTNSRVGPIKTRIAPDSFTITRDRITDEEAAVNFLAPAHPALNVPNKISSQDFDGWIQERSIYHASNWAPSYTPILSMADPGEKASNGALIIAPYGKGNVVYTGLAFFRQLPAGVPGAYRLFANLLAL